MADTTLVVCVDGLDTEYLEACDTPNLRELGRKGFFGTGRCMMPSVTNVNNVSMVTGAYPEAHGISSNYTLVRETGKEIYLESSEYILAETMFQRARSLGRTSVLVAAKDKLRTLIGVGASVDVSSERPPEWLVAGIGPPPEIYSLEVNGWIIRAASYIMSERPADIVYVATTDYAMHSFAPDEPESQDHMSLLDNAIGDLVEAHSDATVLVTADHGMSAKTRMVDLGDALARHGIGANVIPIIKDRYVVHHANLGGCMFVYLEPGHAGRTAEAVGVLNDTPGVEEVLAREEAASRFKLHYERIGDIVVTGEPDVVFGGASMGQMWGQVRVPPRLRSHGSAHELAVPLIAYNGDFDGFSFEENRDVGRYVFERVLT